MQLILLNKPFRVMSQFSEIGDKTTLAEHINTPGVYPAGRLDYDSEGLLLLTDDGNLQAAISNPKHKVRKRYLAQVEGDVKREQIQQLLDGVTLKDGPANALSAECVEEPPWLWPRTPPIRYRASIPDSWLQIEIAEGRNRQVRRMTASVGLPTLRLIRTAIGPWSLNGLAPGEHRAIDAKQAWNDLRKYSRY